MSDPALNALRNTQEVIALARLCRSNPRLLDQTRNDPKLAALLLNLPQDGPQIKLILQDNQTLHFPIAPNPNTELHEENPNLEHRGGVQAGSASSLGTVGSSGTASTVPSCFACVSSASSAGTVGTAAP